MALLETFMNRDVSLWTKAELCVFVIAIEDEVSKAPQIDVPVTNHFSKDVYARTIKLDKGSLVVGKIHKFQNLNVITKGEVSVLSIDGIVRVKAPYTFVGSPGAKRVIYAHKDSEWMTIHGTSETDVDKIEELFIAKSYDEVDVWHGSQLEWEQSLLSQPGSKQS